MWDLSELLHINYFEDCLLFKYLFFIKAIFCNVLKWIIIWKYVKGIWKSKKCYTKVKQPQFCFLGDNVITSLDYIFVCSSLSSIRIALKTLIIFFTYIVYIIDITLSKNWKSLSKLCNFLSDTDTFTLFSP